MSAHTCSLQASPDVRGSSAKGQSQPSSQTRETSADVPSSSVALSTQQQPQAHPTASVQQRNRLTTQHDAQQGHPHPLASHSILASQLPNLEEASPNHDSMLTLQLPLQPGTSPVDAIKMLQQAVLPPGATILLQLQPSSQTCIAATPGGQLAAVPAATSHTHSISLPSAVASPAVPTALACQPLFTQLGQSQQPLQQQQPQPHIYSTSRSHTTLSATASALLAGVGQPARHTWGGHVDMSTIAKLIPWTEPTDPAPNHTATATFATSCSDASPLMHSTQPAQPCRTDLSSELVMLSHQLDSEDTELSSMPAGRPLRSSRTPAVPAAGGSTKYHLQHNEQQHQQVKPLTYMVQEEEQQQQGGSGDEPDVHTYDLQEQQQMQCQHGDEHAQANLMSRKRQRTTYIYGNYHRYYGYRLNPNHEDNRVQVRLLDGAAVFGANVELTIACSDCHY